MAQGTETDKADRAREASATPSDLGAERVNVEEPQEARAARIESKLRALAERLSGGGLNLDARLSIDRDEDADRFVYKIIDARNGEVIRQWPLEDALAVARDRKEAEGLVLDQRV